MQWRWAVAWLLASAGPALGAIVTRQGDKPEVIVNYTVQPGVPSVAQSSLKARSSDLATYWTSSERRAAEEQAATALASEAAAEAQAKAADSDFQASSGARMAKVSAERTKMIRKEAETVAADTRELLDGLPKKLDAAVRRAVSDAYARAIGAMNAEVASTVAVAKAEQAAGAKKAASGAEAAARPFQVAKIRTAQTYQEYINTANELAAAVKELKLKAVELATVAGPLQATGNVVMAQKLNMQARDLMDKALQMADQAKSMHAKAGQIKTTLGGFDVAASQAAAYGAYKANPGGDSLTIPTPPAPLQLPAGVNGPAPAAAPAAAPAPGR